MNEQTTKRDWFYWFIALFTAIQLLPSALLVLDFALHPLEPDFNHQSTPIRLFIMLAIVPVILFIAVLVIRRAPRNVTGLFLLLWVTIPIGDVSRHETQVLTIASVGWVAIWFLPLFFPDGRAFPRRFERHIRLLCVGLMLCLVGWTVSTPSSSTYLSDAAPNPLFIPALEGLFPIVSGAENVVLLITIVIILPSLVARYRGSDERVRQQLKWLAWVFFGIILSAIPMLATGITTLDPRKLDPLQQFIVTLWGVLLTLAPFVAVGNAILRYRLYDIDIIIRRTLIYSVLTAILALIYFGAIVVAQQAFRAATGETPDIAIVISTLLIATLFTPLRRRIQATIDRRLYRRRYDAEQTLARFNQTLREEVNLEELKASLVGVVRDTMQPTKVALWVKEETL